MGFTVFSPRVARASPREGVSAIRIAPTRETRTAWITLAAVIGLGVAFRVWGWSNWSLWLDETMQVDYARRGLRGLIRTVVWDGNNPPLDYLVTYLCRRISEADAMYRLPPVLWSIGTMAALFLRMGGRRAWPASIATAATFAFLPLAIHYGQEVRPYALGLFLVASADAARAEFVRATDGPRRRWFLVTLVAAVGAAYTLHIALVALATIWLGELIPAWRGRARDPVRLRAATLVPVLTVVAFLPWLWAIRGRFGRVNEILAPAITSAVVKNLVVALAASFREDPVGRGLAATLVWGLAIAGLWFASAEERTRVELELLGSGVGVLALLAWQNHWWSLRYVIFVLLPMSRAVGYAIGGVFSLVPRRLAAGSAATVMSLVLLGELPSIRDNAIAGRPDWRRPAGYIDFQSRHGKRGTLYPVDGWTYFALRFQTLRLDPPIGCDFIADRMPLLRQVLSSAPSGWLVRTPHHPVPAEVDAFLKKSRPWAVFPKAEDATVYRFENGRLVDP